jgi:hypothetical protein
MSERVENRAKGGNETVEKIVTENFFQINVRP